MAGCSLLKELNAGGLGIEVVRDYTQQLLEVLAYLHGKSIVHKDMKVEYVPLYETLNQGLCNLYKGRCMNFQGVLQFLAKVLNHLGEVKPPPPHTHTHTSTRDIRVWSLRFNIFGTVLYLNQGYLIIL